MIIQILIDNVYIWYNTLLEVELMNLKKINFKKLPIQIIIFFFGLWVIQCGVAIFLNANIGSDPFTLFTQGVSITLGITPGNANRIITLILLFVLLFLDRSEINIGTFISILCAGPILDGMMSVFNNIMPMAQMNLIIKILLLIISCIAVGVGFAILKSARLGVAPNDMLYLAIVDKTKKSYTVVRLVCDAIFLIVGILLHGVLGIGTIIIWILVAPSIDFFLDRTATFVNKRILKF